MRRGLAAPIGCALLLLLPLPVAGLTCAPTDGYQDEAIKSGWPPDAPYEYVVIATIGDTRPVRGDAQTWGQILELRLDAVLRGDLPLTITEIYNPPLGGSGWGPFRVGHQYLIAAHPPSEGTRGMVSTFQCAPNEEIRSAARFDELVSYAERPLLADTALAPRALDLSLVGWLLIASGVLLIERRRFVLPVRD